MLLARGTARRKEIAIRLALGAGRFRILRQLITEGFMLALLGGGLGLLLGNWSSDLLTASLGSMMPVDMVWTSGGSFAMLAATLAFCILGTFAFALGPALKLSRVGVVDDLKQHAGEDAVPRRFRFLPRNPLVVVQIAFSLALLTAAGLFIRGAGKAANVDIGLKADSTWLLEMDASLAAYDKTRAQQLYRTMSERLAAIPGVEHASIASTVPFGLVTLDRAVQRAGVHAPADAKPATAAEGLSFGAHWNSVGEDYFAAVGLPLLRGRAFTSAEATQPGGPAVAIVDEALARKLWPEGDALGQRIELASGSAPRAKDGGSGGGVSVSGDAGGEIVLGETIEIVGIVRPIRHDLFEKEARGAIYLPFARGFQNNVFFHVRFAAVPAGREAATADLLRRTVGDVDPAFPILSLKSFAQHLDDNIQLWIVRAGAALFSVFGGLALGLAVVGLYGVKAYSVARRTREIGIRMALGAEPRAVQWMILREGGVMVFCGLAIGLLLAAGTGKLLSGLLYQVGALDPVAFTFAPVLLAAAAFLATWLPARRATRISPMAALRTE
jgi:predicted permease